jgi:hypothetical protein
MIIYSKILPTFKFGSRSFKFSRAFGAEAVRAQAEARQKIRSSRKRKEK